MLSKYEHAIVWIAKRMEKQSVELQEISLWQALQLTDKSESGSHTLPYLNQNGKRLVVITGEEQTIFEATNLFTQLPNVEGIRYFVEDVKESSPLYHTKLEHPVCRFIDICYINPAQVRQYLQNTPPITVFLKDTFPLWLRPLLIHNKVAQLVMSKKQVLPTAWSHIGVLSYEEFTYEQLMNDFCIVQEPKVSTDNLPIDVPKNLRVAFEFALQKKNEVDRQAAFIQALDDAAQQMLDEYWLRNNPPVQKWLPVLLKEVDEYLRIRANAKADASKIETLYNEIERWGRREKHVI